MTDRVNAPRTPDIPIKPVQTTGGEIKPAPKSDTFDPMPPNETSGGMAGQGGDTGKPDQRREGGMIGEG